MLIIERLPSFTACNEQGKQNGDADINSPTESSSQEYTPTPLPMSFNDPDVVNIVEFQFYGDHLDNLDWKRPVEI